MRVHSDMAGILILNFLHENPIQEPEHFFLGDIDFIMQDDELLEHMNRV